MVKPGPTVPVSCPAAPLAAAAVSEAAGAAAVLVSLFELLPQAASASAAIAATAIVMRRLVMPSCPLASEFALPPGEGYARQARRVLFLSAAPRPERSPDRARSR